jgi:uncharacterized protein (TIGR01777 family)
MKILVSGASGLIGSALVARLAEGGDRVTRLVRSRKQVGDGAFYWDPAQGEIDERALDGVDAVAHLSGETVAGRWTGDKKRRIRESRLGSTRLLSEAIARAQPRPSTLISASAVGFYGDRGDEQLTEQSEPGSGFLADVVRDWEAATRAAADAGVRVVNVRSGIVLSSDGGALATMLLPFRLGVGGRLGSGRQWMSWIALDDEIDLIRDALTNDELSGPVNATAPNPVTNREFTSTLGHVLRRPTVLRTPAPLLRLLVGEFAEQGLLAGQRASPARALASGFHFTHAELEGALRHLLHDR